MCVCVCVRWWLHLSYTCLQISYSPGAPCDRSLRCSAGNVQLIDLIVGMQTVLHVPQSSSLPGYAGQRRGKTACDSLH